MTLSASPANFTLSNGQTQQVNITANVAGLPLGAWAFGYVILTDGSGATVHFPVAVKPIAGQATLNVNPTSLSATQATNTTTSQTLTIGNTGTAALTWNIAEAPGTCQSPQDIPWLSTTPNSGTTNAGASTPVTVGFNSTGLAAGTYNAKLCVNSNDPTTPLVEVPVSLTVEQATAVTLSDMDTSRSPAPVGVPMAALPAAAAAAFAVIVALRRRR
jgi:hypothetical protein